MNGRNAVNCAPEWGRRRSHSRFRVAAQAGARKIGRDRIARSRHRHRFGPVRATNEDGSLTFHVQNESPGKDKESSWLPAPDGPIYMVMRLYWPKTDPPSILPPGQGTWQPPPVKKVGK